LSIRIVRTGNDPVLRQKAKEVPLVSPVIEKLLTDMAETMYAEEGIGLAANQIGVAKRVVVIDIGEGGPGLLEFVNPVLVSQEGVQIATEGCLSLPGLSGKVSRAQRIQVKALNRQGEWFELEATDLLARCIQHEIDHLDGILFTDYLKPSEIRYEATQETTGR
jgi:peptide deformylase